MLSKSEIIEIVREQLALECNCDVADFDCGKNIINLPGFSDERRKFCDKPFFFKMLSFGENAVISADEQLHEWLGEFIKNKSGHWLFEYPNLRKVGRKLELLKKQLNPTHHMYLPLGQSKEINSALDVKWYEGDEFRQFYGDKRFSNALCSKFMPERPDILAIASFENGEITGMAGCSSDTPMMWQIGIDVDKRHRGKGIGTTLVSMLKDEILKRGKIPYYGTSLSNIHSWNIAINCGFRPYWIEIETMEDGIIE